MRWVSTGNPSYGFIFCDVSRKIDAKLPTELMSNHRICAVSLNVFFERFLPSTASTDTNCKGRALFSGGTLTAYILSRISFTRRISTGTVFSTAAKTSSWLTSSATSPPPKSEMTESPITFMPK